MRRPGRVVVPVAFLSERFYGNKFFLAGDELPTVPKRVLFISNHRTRLDWMFLWFLALCADTAAGLRIILKAGLRHVPFFGFSLQHFEFCFLEVRRWLCGRSWRVSWCCHKTADP